MYEEQNSKLTLSREYQISWIKCIVPIWKTRLWLITQSSLTNWNDAVRSTAKGSLILKSFHFESPKRYPKLFCALLSIWREDARSSFCHLFWEIWAKVKNFLRLSQLYETPIFHFKNSNKNVKRYTYITWFHVESWQKVDINY